MNYFIIGIEKCGTTSLEAELKKKGHNVIRWEWAYCFPNIRQLIKRNYPNHKITFIVRNPVERCYSDYHYALRQKQIPQVSYETALKHYPRFAQGSAFGKWIKKDDIVFHISQLTEHKLKANYKPMTAKQIRLTRNAIITAYKTPYHRNYSEIDWYKLGLYYDRSDVLKGFAYNTARKLKHGIKKTQLFPFH